MFDYPSDAQVADDFGDKIIDAIREAVGATSKDLLAYREWRPGWVAAHSERGLANWIHDRLWDHLVKRLIEVPQISFREEGATREFRVGTRYRLRAKRHTIEGLIQNYLTQTALEFEVQSTTLPGLEEVRLYCGYVWSPDERTIGGAVISLHDGRDEVIWITELIDPQSGSGTIRPIWPSSDAAPAAPTISMPKIDRLGREDMESDGG